MSSDLWKVAGAYLVTLTKAWTRLPAGEKMCFTIIPQAAIENPLIYLDDIMCYSCSPAVLSLF